MQRLVEARHQLLKLVNLIDDLSTTQFRRSFTEQQLYEQRKANKLCTQSKSCTNKVVPQHTMCSFHLRKAAEAQDRKRIKS